MEFRRYQHLERFGTTEVQNIELGECFIFPKIDGTNASVWLHEGEIQAGSRTRHLSLEKDNAGFYEWVLKQENLLNYLKENPTHRLFGEWLCLSGDTKIRLVSGGKNGHTRTLREMYEYSKNPVIEKNYYKTKKTTKEYFTTKAPWWERYGYPQCFSLFLDEDKIKPQRIAKIIFSGNKAVYEIKTRKGYNIKSTLEHKFLTNNGWKSLSDIKTGDVLAVTELFNHRQKRKYGVGSRKILKLFKDLRNKNNCRKCGASTSLEVHHKDENWENNNLENLEVLCRDCHSTIHKNITSINKSFDYEFDKITSIEYKGIEDCYDISMGAEENSSSFVANGFIVHNCPHSLKTYRENAWRNFYVFDVAEVKKQEELLHEGDDHLIYKHYNFYQPILEKYGINYIPPISIIQKGDYEYFLKQLEKNVFLIEDGKGAGEGIVIKNYDFRNKYNRNTFAKIVTSEFKEKHAKEMGASVVKRKDLIEETIADEFVTKALCEKVFSKIENQGGWSSKKIPQLLNTVFYDLVKEDSWEFVKKHKNPNINFGTLQHFTFMKVKEHLPQVF